MNKLKLKEKIRIKLYITKIAHYYDYFLF